MSLSGKEGSFFLIRFCRPLQRADGYPYQKGEVALPPRAFRQGSPRHNPDA